MAIDFWMTLSLEKFDFEIDKKFQENFLDIISQVEMCCHYGSKIPCKT